MTVGERIQQRMKALNLSQRHIASHTGATKGAVSQWVNDKVKPSSDYLMPLCKILQCEQEWLLKGSIRSKPKEPIHQINDLNAHYHVELSATDSLIKTILKLEQSKRLTPKAISALNGFLEQL